MITTKEKEIFASLIEDCEKKALIHSGMMDKLPPFIDVVDMARSNPDHLPTLFTALQRQFRWCTALKMILNDEPDIAKEDAGKVKVIIDARLDFGKQKGII